MGSWDPAAIRQELTSAFDGVEAVEVWGDLFFYVRPSSPPEPHDAYFATIKAGDDEYDRASELNRPGVFRLNIGVGKATFDDLFDGTEVVDPTALDRLMPHPLYASGSWICVLNPSAATFEALRPLLWEAYERAADRVEKRRSRRSS